MIDRFKVYAKGGDGGNGCQSMRRSRHERHGHPDGTFYLCISLTNYWISIILE